MFKILNKNYYLNFYGAIIIAFFFNFIFSSNVNQEFSRCLWIKSDHLDNEETTKDIISKAYRSGYKIIFLQLDVHDDYRYNPHIDYSNKKLDFDPLYAALYWSNLYDIEIHIWINAYKIWSSTWPPNPDHIFYKLKKNHKDWFASDINGHSDYNFDFIKTSNNFSGIYLSPLNQEVNIYIENIVEKLLDNYKGKFHGIHLDYFRYKDSMYGYNYIGRKIFYDIHNVDPIYLNKDISSINFELNDSITTIKDKWLAFKNGHIDSLIKGLNTLIDNYNEVKSKNIKLSVAVKPDIYEAKLRWNQNWDSWLNNNFVDFVVVMNYYSDTESFSNNLWKIYKYFYSSKNIDNIYIGINTLEQNLGSVQLRDVNLIKQQIQNTRDFSFPGVAIFSSEYYKFNPTLYLEIFSERQK